MKSINFHKWVVFEINHQTGYYQKRNVQPEIYPVNALPYELKREKLRKETYTVDEGLTTKKIKENGQKEILTGFVDTKIRNLFVGNMMHKGVRSLVIVYFSLDNRHLHIFLYTDFCKPNKMQSRLFAEREFIELHIKVNEYDKTK
jgi:hypothetical protein